jgi:transcriptional regulator with XRE-family HTH domain
MIQSLERGKSLPRLTVRFFRESTGTEPVRDWLKGLASTEKREIGSDIKTVQFGRPIGMPVVDRIEGEIWEVRTRLGAQDAEGGSGLAKQRLKKFRSAMTMKAARKANLHIGSDFDDFLREEGIYDQAQAVAVKRVLAYELERNMLRAQLTKTDMAKRMGTTRAQLDRLLNPENPSTTLQTLVKAAGAVGKRVKISLVNA